MKTGYKTTEFWLAMAVNAAVSMELISAAEGAEVVNGALVAAAALVNVAYILGRALVKVRGELGDKER